MNCPGCGVDVVEQSIYCHKCGARLDDGEAQLSEGRADQPGGGMSGPRASPPSPVERFVSGPAAGRGVEPVEEDLWEGGYCAKAMAGAWAVSLLATAALLSIGVWFWNNAVVWWIVLGAILVVWGYQLGVFVYRRLGVHYRLTSQRFFHESGVLMHTTDLIEVIDMDDITYRQSLIDRLTGVGTIRIVSSDRSHPDLSITGIEGVQQVAAMMQDARHRERVRRGLHVEQI